MFGTAWTNASGRGTAEVYTRQREGYGEREGERRGRWWEGSDMADVTACVGEYRLCCQPGVSLMKIGIQVSCHSFSMSERGAGEHFSLFFSLSLSLQKAGHYSYRLAEG